MYEAEQTKFIIQKCHTVEPFPIGTQYSEIAREAKWILIKAPNGIIQCLDAY